MRDVFVLIAFWILFLVFTPGNATISYVNSFFRKTSRDELFSYIFDLQPIFVVWRIYNKY